MAATELLDRLAGRARRDPAFRALLAELADAPSTSAGRYQAASRLNALRLDEARDRFRAGALTTAEVQARLGVATPQAVSQLRRRGRLVGRRVGNPTWYPAWQFGEDGLRPDLPDVLERLGRFTTDAVAADRIMRLERPELDDHSIADSLDDPARAPTAWLLLDTLGQS